MPSRTPSEDVPERFTFKTDTIATDYAAYQTLTPKRVKEITMMAQVHGELGPLYGLYERMETTDTRYGGLIGQLKAAMGGFRLKIQPAEGTSAEEKQIADDYARVMREVLTHLDQQALVKMFTSPYFTGAKLYRLRWSLRDYPYGRKIWMPDEVAPVDGRVLFSSKDPKRNFGDMYVRTVANPDGEHVASMPFGSVIFLEGDYGNDRYDRIGKSRQCLPWYLGLQFVQSWWIQYIEGYAAPLRIGRVPRGVDPKKRMDMERFLQVLGQHGYALFPNDLEVQLLEANRQGTITTYGDFIRKGHEEYAVALLGQASTVGTSGQGGAPYAGAVVANSIRHEIMQDVAGLVRGGFRELSRTTIRANYGPQMVERLLPTITPVLISPQDMEKKAKVATTAQDNGVSVPLMFWYEQVLGIEPPREGEEAVMHGQRYIVGEAEPKPKEERQAERAAKEAKAEREAERDRDRGERSVATDGNDSYADQASGGS